MADTILSLFQRRVEKSRKLPALRYKEGSVWKDVSWGEYSRRIDDFTRGLLSLGVKRGDKVGLIGSNTPEWFVSDMAIMTMGDRKSVV